MPGQLSYKEKYAILAGRVIFADNVQRNKAINEGQQRIFNIFPQTRHPSIISLIRNGQVNTSGAELSTYLNENTFVGSSASVPAVPSNICVIPSDSALTILFLAGSDGGSPITNYSYSTDGITYTPLSPSVTTSPLTISGLTNGIVYTIYIKAINAIGSSPASAAVTAAPIPSSFDPIMIGNIRVWLDGQNSSKVITTSGIVTGWDDSSTLTNNFTAAGIITYDLPSPLNNRPALNFTVPNATSIYKNAFIMTPGKNELSVFMVLSQTGKGTGNSELFYTKSDYRYFDLFNNTNPTYNGKLHINVHSDTQHDTDVDIITTPASIVIISATVSPPITGPPAISPKANVYVNGAVTSVNNTTLVNDLPLNTILDWAISGGGFKGYVGELITYNALLSDEGREKVEGYLAWKWGLQSQLSATNPWKTSPPTNASPPGAPTLTFILGGNTLAYVYYTAGTGTVVNYQYTTDSGTTYTNVNPVDPISPSVIPGLTNGSSATLNLRAYNSGGYSSISNGLSITPSNPSVPAAWLLIDPHNSSCYSGTGTTVNNIGSFGALAGTIGGSLTYITGTGITNKVFNFTGGRIVFGSFNFGANFTITAWIYPTAKNNINTILANGPPNVGTAGFKFAWNSYDLNGADKRLFFESGDGTGGANWKLPGTVPNTVVMNSWQQVAVIFDNTLSIAVFLVNGMPVSVSDISTATNVTVNAANFNIGSYVGTGFAMQAQLGLLKVFNSSLTASQVLADFTSTRSVFGV